MDDLSGVFAPLPEPPYVVMSFTSHLTGDAGALSEFTGEVYRLAARHPGFIGVEKARNPQGFGVLLVCWKDLASLEEWRAALDAYLEELGTTLEGLNLFDRATMRIMRVEAQETLDLTAG